MSAEDSKRTGIGNYSNRLAGIIHSGSKNPLSGVVLGFLLSGVLGALLGFYLNNYRSDRERSLGQARALYETSLQAVDEFTRLAYERRERSAMLVSAFKRGAILDEVRERKRSYDDVYVRWNANIKSYLFSMRAAAPGSTYTQLEYYTEFALASIYKNIDACLTQAYDDYEVTYDATRRAAPTSTLRMLDECRMSDLLGRALDCNYAITDSFFNLVGRIQSNWPGENAADSPAHLGDVPRDCPVPRED